MNTELWELVNASDGRYFTSDEEAKVLKFAQTLPARFQAAAKVKAAEEPIVKSVIERMKQLYPNMARYHAAGWEKAHRDVQLVLRYNVQAMVCNDLQALEDKLLFWLRTILKSVNLTPKFIADTYVLLTQSCRDALPAEAFQLLEPALSRTLSVLSDVPEPHTAAV